MKWMLTVRCQGGEDVTFTTVVSDKSPLEYLDECDEAEECAKDAPHWRGVRHHYQIMFALIISDDEYNEFVGREF